jgi:phosphoribosyl-ATP pyrophosphohydrolase/phosphoribosyl-AMP cyclohydrolase
MISSFDIKAIDWQKTAGLIPAIIQDSVTKTVLMLGYMNEAAVHETLRSGKVTFYSRTKQRLWVKGESSGHFLHLIGIELDCDNDTLLVTVRPHGPTCHQGTQSCFPAASQDQRGFIYQLDELIAARKHQLPEGSYTTRLFTKGINKIAQKVGEEAVETVIAAKDDDRAAFLGEAADLLYHLLVLLHAKNDNFEAVVTTLEARHKPQP